MLESDLIYDILNLNVRDPRNTGVVRNMLILIVVMLVTGNEKAIEQMKKFDLLTMLLTIMIECQTLGYLALSCVGLLASKIHFREQI